MLYNVTKIKLFTECAQDSECDFDATKPICKSNSSKLFLIKFAFAKIISKPFGNNNKFKCNL